MRASLRRAGRSRRASTRTRETTLRTQGTRPAGRQRLRLTGRFERRLPDGLERVEGDLPVFDGVAEDPLEHRHCLDDRMAARVGGQQLAAEDDDTAGVDVAQRHRAQAGRGVLLPQTAIGRQRRALELDDRVRAPPLCEELPERLAAAPLLAQLFRAPASRAAALGAEEPSRRREPSGAEPRRDAARRASRRHPAAARQRQTVGLPATAAALQRRRRQ